MPDIFDLLGGGKKDAKPQESTDSNQKSDGLEFLTQFKKRVTSSSPTSEETNKPNATEEAVGSGGITPLDIAGLPEAQKRIMFSILRDKDAAREGITTQEIQHRLASEEEISATLDQLAKDEWLLVYGIPPDERYKPNLRRKKGRLSGNIWAAISD